MAADMAVDGDPLDQLHAFRAARAAAPPDAYDVIARFGQRPLTDAVCRAPPLPPLIDKGSAWLRGLACDTQLWRDPSFCLAPLAAAPQQPPDIKPFDLSALQAAFTFRPSVVELTEAEKGAPLVPPPPPPPPPPTAAELAAEQERLQKERERKERKKEKKREREGEATAATGGTSGGDVSEGDKRTSKAGTSPSAPPAKVARTAPAAERKHKEVKVERERDKDRDKERNRDRDRGRDKDRERDRDRDRDREHRKQAKPAARERSPAAYAAPAPVVPLAGCVPKGWVVVPEAPELSPALIGCRVAMKGVGNRGESWCWGVVKQYYKQTTEEGWNVEVAWGGGQKELRDCRLHPDFYSTDPAEHPDMTEAWVLLDKA